MAELKALSHFACCSHMVVMMLSANAWKALPRFPDRHSFPVSKVGCIVGNTMRLLCVSPHPAEVMINRYLEGTLTHWEIAAL
eukprot:5226895-Amphidinium_carterae.1